MMQDIETVDGANAQRYGVFVIGSGPAGPTISPPVDNLLPW